MPKNKISIKESANEFGFKLFKVFIERHQNEYKNLCFSPFAVFNSLAMIIIGAKNSSESQLAKVLNLKDFNEKKKFEELRTLRESIIEANHDIILAGSYLYVDKSINLRQEYRDVLRDYFSIKTINVAFDQIEETIKTINENAMESTDNVIDEVIATKDITDNKNVKLILTNAFLFRGFWASSFDKIEKQAFSFAKKTESIEIEMMRQLGFHRYFEDKQLKAKIISLEYVTSDLRMLVILPDDESSDVYLINKLNREKFNSITNNLRSIHKRVVDVSIPRFALDTQKISLQRTLMKMGAKDIFDESKSDLTDMCDNNIHFTKLVHKAFILVDERGANPSKVEIQINKNQLKWDKRDKVYFNANHPFIFIIYDKISNVVVFMGQFSDPTEMLEVVPECDLTQEEINELLSQSEPKQN